MTENDNIGFGGPRQKPTIVLIHGAWHTPDYYNAVVAQLKEYGYLSRTMHLPSAGGDLSTTVADDAAYNQKTVSELVSDGKEVVLAMHSDGGIPGTESVKGLLKKDRERRVRPVGFISLVYVTAFLIPVGASLASFLGGIADWVKFDSVADEYIPKLLHQAKPSFYTPLTYAAYQHVPVFYLLCEQDNTIPLAGQQAMAGIGGPDVTTHVCKAGHSPILSMPGKVVDVIRQAAGEVTSSNAHHPHNGTEIFVELSQIAVNKFPVNEV